MQDATLAAASLLLTLLINIPFGYWRAHAKKRGRRKEWFAAIHVPVVLLIIVRLALGVQSWALIPLNMLAFFTGQLLGGRLHNTLDPRCPQGAGRNLLRDLRECRAPRGQGL